VPVGKVIRFRGDDVRWELLLVAYVQSAGGARFTVAGVPRQISRPDMMALTWAGLIERHTIKVSFVAQALPATAFERTSCRSIRSDRCQARSEVSLRCSCRRACWCSV
jgi:hypothetical protein